MLEVSFDSLLYHDNKAMLGDSADLFGYEFPIRFDFLDTFDGQNLSLQCHPSEGYIYKHFGEKFTQDETYYMLDCGEESEVYLGFQEGVDKNQFRLDLEQSYEQKKPVNVEEYVQTFQSSKHDLFLIPSGTIHCSGEDNLVLEISNTPYIFTFKMYDWLRVDLDGNPRPINIERAFENLDFSRQGKTVEEELISKPETLEEGADWKVENLPTHPNHFYAIHRIELESQLDIATNGKCHVLSLVEGEAITVTTQNSEQVVHYAETFVIPDAAASYKIINHADTAVKVVKAFVKDEEGVNMKTARAKMC
jgi:mannose-6-phosphate isomerase class I